jgi:eukaryotic-like serine/threonine-protein kinase
MSRNLLGILSIAAVGIAAAAAACGKTERPPILPPPLQSVWVPPPQVEPGAGSEFPFGLAISPEGRRLIYPATRGGILALQLDDLSTGRSTVLPSTGGAVAPFWSTDGQRVGYFANGQVRMIELESGSVTDVAEAPNGRGAAWNAAGDLVFAPSADTGLMLRSASGSLRPLTTLDPAKGDTSHRWPAFLPDGRHVVFLVRSNESSRTGVWLASLDQPDALQRLVSSDAQAIVAGVNLLYATSEALMAQPLDPNTWQVAGPAALVGLPIGRGPLDQLFATASDQVLIYGPAGTTLRELRWAARDGTTIGRAGEPAEAWNLRISPDEGRIAVTELDPQTRSLDVWLQDKSSPVPQRLSLSIDADTAGAWSPDGSRVAYISGRRRVTLRGSGAVVPEQTLATFDAPVEMWDWSRDNAWLVIGRSSPDSQADLWLLPPTGNNPARPYATLPFNQVDGAVSPDGRWIAYASDESGKFDIYIDSFPAPKARVRLTTVGGVAPRWRRDGKELYFRRGSEIHAVTLNAAGAAPPIAATSTKRLFDAATDVRAYDASADGQRFLLNLPAASAPARPATMVMNWFSRTGHGNTETRK